jgi:hypothetical protein
MAENTDRQPEWEWVENMVAHSREFGAKLFFKENLTVKPQLYPEILGR